MSIIISVGITSVADSVTVIASVIVLVRAVVVRVAQYAPFASGVPVSRYIIVISIDISISINNNSNTSYLVTVGAPLASGTQ